ncbi:MAG: uroporphyrinogen-III synthase [Waddliaceae bacterium]
MPQITIAARSSPLSKAQVKEIESLIPEVTFIKHFVETTGDLDRKTSLRGMEKTDFFTRELDQMLLEKKCDICVHSAKDLPDPLPEGLSIFALTKGVDSSDSLVFNKALAERPLIATSSIRREECVREIYPSARFIDLRGTIDERLKLLESEEVDGVVVAEAALIRLNLTHYKRIKLPGETTPYQGQLAILGRKGEGSLKSLFSKLDIRKKALHIGLTPPDETLEKNILHHPMINIVQRPNVDLHSSAPFLLFTSKVAVDLFFDQATPSPETQILAIGKATARRVEKRGSRVSQVAEESTLEGVIALLKKIPAEDRHCFWPHSALSRDVLRDFFNAEGGTLRECILYDTRSSPPSKQLNLTEFEEVIFTSPSCVESFAHFFGTLPSSVKWRAMGPVTEKKCTAVLR